jgi:hypothetical protein
MDSMSVAISQTQGRFGGLSICHDIEITETARLMALAGADCLLVPTDLTVSYDAVPRAVGAVLAMAGSKPSLIKARFDRHHLGAVLARDPLLANRRLELHQSLAASRQPE